MEPEDPTSSSCEVRRFDSADTLAHAAAADWLELMRVLDLAGREPTVALSGGRIGAGFLAAAREAFSKDPGLIRRTHFFWADERCVPPDHAASNFALAAGNLFKPLAIPESNIHRIPGELEPALGAETATRALMKWSRTEPGDIPLLDLVFLGMGEDGHVASLFPDGPVSGPDPSAVYRPVTAVKPPPQRITLTYPVLAKADNVWVLVSGEGKEAALRASLTAPSATPLGRVIESRSGTRIYTDVAPAQPLDA